MMWEDYVYGQINKKIRTACDDDQSNEDIIYLGRFLSFEDVKICFNASNI